MGQDTDGLMPTTFRGVGMWAPDGWGAGGYGRRRQLPTDRRAPPSLSRQTLFLVSPHPLPCLATPPFRLPAPPLSSPRTPMRGGTHGGPGTSGAPPFTNHTQPTGDLPSFPSYRGHPVPTPRSSSRAPSLSSRAKPRDLNRPSHNHPQPTGDQHHLVIPGTPGTHPTFVLPSPFSVFPSEAEGPEPAFPPTTPIIPNRVHPPTPTCRT